jgi:molybdenum cofactor biosynthesis protein B
MDAYASPSAQQHRAQAPAALRCAVVTVSDTRTLATDRGGDLIVERLAAAGHSVAERALVPDEPVALTALVGALAARPDVDAILLTGGTGLAARDRTPDALRGLFALEIPGYGELFRMLSYQEIGAAAMLSRAVGGVINRKVVLLMPGSVAAVRLALEKLILPELPHLVEHATH